MLSILLENIVRKLKKHKWIDNILFGIIVLGSMWYLIDWIVDTFITTMFRLYVVFWTIIIFTSIIIIVMFCKDKKYKELH